ncbi:Retrotransposon nucleocapsid protein [Phytophthora megakarya]|uniref:Retrotransposon nucleocapsid protein n=1 Tax=Phytophthora megakarya TaxID=4795 RepID=A0A225VR14_9STRA|nr:Retrotransposon nucleocapsid protein [Phytophthora megakarya]
MLKSKKHSLTFATTLRRHFEQLKCHIGQTPVLTIADFRKDFSLVWTLRILQWRPVAFAGRKFKAAEVNYSIREKELLAILFALRPWRVYLLDRPFVVETDHQSLETVIKQKTISRRIARWYDELTEYRFEIRYIEGNRNEVADGISRRPDVMTTHSGEAITLAAITTRSHFRSSVDGALSATVAEAINRYEEYSTTAVLLRLLSTKTPLSTINKEAPTAPRHFERYSLQEGRLYYRGGHHKRSRLVLPRVQEVLDHVLEEFHDSPVYGHPAIDCTARLFEEHYYWPRMIRNITKYVKGCKVCVRTKSRNEKPPGLINSPVVPTKRRTHVAMDFIVQLPITSSGYDSVMVVVDQLTKRAYFVPGKVTDKAQDVAMRYRQDIFRLHGLPNVILSDRDSKFTSLFWKMLCELLKVEQKLTAAFRPQGDGVTKRLNQTLDNYLRAFPNVHWDDWYEQLSSAELAYNARFQAVIQMSPFEADIEYIPRTSATLNLPSQPPQTTKHSEFILRQSDLLAKARRCIAVAQERMADQFNKNR